MSRQQIVIFVAEDTIELEDKINHFIDTYKSVGLQTVTDYWGIDKRVPVYPKPRVINQSITAKGKKLISQLLVEYDCDELEAAE